MASVWKYIKPLLDAIVFSSIWISLGALSLCLTLFKLLEIKPDFHTALFIFLSTFFGYNLLKIRGLSSEENLSVFSTWLNRNKRVLYLFLVFSFLALIYAAFYLNYPQIVVVVVSSFLSLIYVGVERFNLRSFWFLKTPIVAFVWAFFIVGLTVFSERTLYPLFDLICFFSAVFLFIQGLTIPFEIRDLSSDEKVKELKTIPMLFGLKKTKIIAIFHLVLSLIFFSFFSLKLLMLFPIYFSAIATIISLRKESSEYNYTFVLDGLIILVYPLVYFIA